MATISGKLSRELRDGTRTPSPLDPPPSSLEILGKRTRAAQCGA